MSDNHAENHLEITIDRVAVSNYFTAMHAIAFGVFGILTLGVGLLIGLAYYALFGRWLIARQTEELQYRVEGDSLRVNSGVFFLRRKVIPLNRVTDFMLVQGPIMRMFGIWAIHVQTAGHMQTASEAVLYGIEQPEVIREELLKRRNNFKRDF